VRVRVHRCRLLHRAPQLRVLGLHGCSIDLLGRRPGAAPLFDRANLRGCEVEWNSGGNWRSGEGGRVFYAGSRRRTAHAPRGTTTLLYHYQSVLQSPAAVASDECGRCGDETGAWAWLSCGVRLSASVVFGELGGWWVGGPWIYPLVKHWHRAT
jgi:hypothetical protein